MFNFFKNILGIPPNSGEGSGGENPHSSNFRNDFWEGRAGNNRSDDENHITIISEENVNVPGIPTFNDPFEIHKFVEQFFDRMFDSSEIFRMPIGSIFFSEDRGGTSSQFSTEPSANPHSLRDSFLKAPDTNNTGLVKKKDIDLDGKVTADDVENYLKEEPKIAPKSFFPNFNIFIHHGGDDDHGEINQQENIKNFNSFNQSPNFKFYSKSVYVESVVNPDGSIKIIKKVQDSSGNEETIIEDKYSSNIPNDQLLPPDDSSGISIFKKFFPF